MLSVYNSLSNKKETFKPINEGRVSMYVCGMTVYDYCHLGHARVMVVFDTLYRHLKALGYEVNYVRNITDVDDKIIQRAQQRNIGFEALTEEFINAMHEDERALGVLNPVLEPRATAHILEMIEMIETLEEKGYAYQGKNGDVFYAVKQFEEYGKLSGRNIEDLRAGERVDIDNNKRDPLDFALWKAVSNEDEPSWDSPWGPGRPGWHIECSAMATEHLGETIDIHGGGHDLQFPHHENEIAQSESCSGHSFANYWLHNGFIRVDDEKMSKSLGNFFTIREVLEHYPAEAIRYFILSSHYRSPLNYSQEQLDAAVSALDKLYKAIDLIDGQHTMAITQLDGACDSYVDAFMQAMNDDFNSPEAYAVLYNIVKNINILKSDAAPESEKKAMALCHGLKSLAQQLGLLNQDYSSWNLAKKQNNKNADRALSDAEIDALVQQRSDAKANKDWQSADDIRDQLKGMGVVIEDDASGSSWHWS